MATLLDELLIRIQAETSGAEEGLERTERKTDSLGKSFAGLAARAAGALTAVLSVGQAISGAISRAADVEALNRTSEALGIGITELDAFGLAAERMGGDAQGARDSLTDMAESIGEALQDIESGRAKTFAALGISLRDVNGQSKDAIAGILDLADAVQDMSKEEAIFRIKELGITDNRTVEMVLKGRKELERMLATQKESNAITKEQAERALTFNASLSTLRQGISAGANSLFDWMIPALQKGVEWLTIIVDWVSEHKDFVVGFFGAIAAVVAAVYLPAMIAAAAATLAATWPIIAIGAAVVAAAAAFALLYDDIMNFIDGNDSFIGQIFEKYPMVQAIVMGIIDAFKLMGSTLLGIFNMILDGWNMLFGGIMAGVSQIVSGVRSVGRFFGFGGGSSTAAAGAQLASAGSSPLNGTTSAAISNSSSGASETNVPIGQITINTQATDAQGISREIGSSLDDQLRNLDAQTATAVTR